jgi:hypothetical protein
MLSGQLAASVYGGGSQRESSSSGYIGLSSRLAFDRRCRSHGWI